MKRLTPLIFVWISMVGTGAFLTSAASAQDVGSTEARLEELREEIAEEERMLARVENEERASMTRLSDLNRQLALREELVRTYQQQVEQLGFERDSLQQAITALDDQLETLRSEYRKRATHAYKYGRQHDAALILSASSINQMLVRVSYLRRFTQKRKNQLDGLQATSQALIDKRTEMQRSLVETEAALGSIDREQENLSGLMNTVRAEIRDIQAEKTTRAEILDEKRGMEQDLIDQIAALIAAEANRPRARGAEDIIALRSTSFEGARGQLPWPSEGTIQEPFGDIVHPEFGTRTPNPGILIGTEAAAEVVAAFGGRVSTIDIIPDMGRFAIVEHGAFHTVYGNLSLFYIGVGDEVTAGQLIGRTGTDAEPRGTALFFAVFRDGQAEDPVGWLRPR